LRPARVVRSSTSCSQLPHLLSIRSTNFGWRSGTEKRVRSPLLLHPFG
jgi:hypothetical protein